jgi:mono/diheme cytochrome c family protein
VTSRCLALSTVVCALGCAARPVPTAHGIELDNPNEVAEREAPVDAGISSDPALIAAGTDPATVASDPVTSDTDDGRFVYSRRPLAEQARDVARFPIHIHESWWPFRAQHLGITPARAQRRDAQISHGRAPADFWDSQTALEAVSVWTVLCNECHGGRRNLEDAAEMPAPAPAWGEGTGLFFGNRRAYEHMFEVVHDGGPVRESGRAEMPAWRRVLSTEMIWALLYFLEYQSGGIESRFPPSLYPRRPKVLGER